MTDSVHTYRMIQQWTNPSAPVRCCLATDNSLWTPGGNSQCEEWGHYPIPAPLNEYLVDGHVCKQHLKYLLKNQHEWIDAFIENGVPKGQKIQDLQDSYRKQAVFSELGS